MHSSSWLTEGFEANRIRLRGVAYRLLGSLSDADDAVQETWLRLNQTDRTAIENLSAWLTTVVARVCLDMLRGRKIRDEWAKTELATQPRVARAATADPESEALLADAVGVALLVVLEALGPAERLAFVLHDLFALSFDEIGVILGRSPGAAKQLASRARRRVRASRGQADGGHARQRKIVEAFLSAIRAGDLQGLLAVLDPEAVLHIDAASRAGRVERTGDHAADPGKPRELAGASTWAAQMIALTRGLPTRFVELVVIDGVVGVIVAPRGTLVRALAFTFTGDRIARIESIADPARLGQFKIAVL
jgi:RNA polymerase sigma factor (sigma-70 family)